MHHCFCAKIMQDKGVVAFSMQMPKPRGSRWIGNLGQTPMACEQELDMVLEEDFLDLLLMMVREMPNAELWQMPSNRSGSSGALEASGSSMLAVRTLGAVTPQLPTTEHTAGSQLLSCLVSKSGCCLVVCS